MQVAAAVAVAVLGQGWRCKVCADVVWPVCFEKATAS